MCIYMHTRKVAVGSMDGEKLTLTVPQAAEQLGIGERTLYRLIATGKFPVVRVGRRQLVPRWTPEQWLRAVAAAGVEVPTDAETTNTICNKTE